MWGYEWPQLLNPSQPVKYCVGLSSSISLCLLLNVFQLYYKSGTAKSGTVGRSVEVLSLKPLVHCVCSCVEKRELSCTVHLYSTFFGT